MSELENLISLNEEIQREIDDLYNQLTALKAQRKRNTFTINKLRRKYKEEQGK